MLTLVTTRSGLTVPKGSGCQSHSTQGFCERQAAFREVAKLEANLPCVCQVHFSDPNKPHCFQPTVTPSEGNHQGGYFHFETIDVVWGLNKLFADLLNCDDSLNIKATERICRTKRTPRIMLRLH
uniref:Uncharacterized protein n=1 Tax=Lynx canadensis TaxID=61383 RepID=A0A667HMX1_LYNCA